VPPTLTLPPRGKGQDILNLRVNKPVDGNNAPEDPPMAAKSPDTRCPFCDAPVEPQQLICLNCGCNLGPRPSRGERIRPDGPALGSSPPARPPSVTEREQESGEGCA